MTDLSPAAREAAHAALTTALETRDNMSPTHRALLRAGEPTEPAPDTQLHAHASNTIARILHERGHWVPLSVREELACTLVKLIYGRGEAEGRRRAAADISAYHDKILRNKCCWDDPVGCGSLDCQLDHRELATLEDAATLAEFGYIPGEDAKDG